MNNTTPPPAPTTTTGADNDYFSDDDYIGQEVTITATVDHDLTEQAVVVNGSMYGDDSLLVLFDKPGVPYDEGDSIKVTGTVERFSYDKFREKYGLIEASMYELYADEQFLLAKSATEVGPTPTS